ncbi:MAG: hypothetical protein AB1721_01295 [Patescibacteria group bacterium]
MFKKRPPEKINPNASLEEQEKYWQEEFKKEPIKIEKEGRARQCRFCGAINPCTGVDSCSQCGRSLRGAKRIPDTRHNSPNQRPDNDDNRAFRDIEDYF